MAVCIFYTCLGGIRAVIWTDVIQLTMMFAVMILVSVKGTISVGGLNVVLERNWNGGRIEAPDFRINPTIRHTFWTLFVGGSCYWIIDNTHQTFIQRFLSLKSVEHAKKAAKFYVFGLTLLISLCIYNGLLLFAYYHDCDPLTSAKVEKKDQMMPFFVMEILSDLPGFTGVFIAGIFSGKIYTCHSNMNIKVDVYFNSCTKFTLIRAQFLVSYHSWRFLQVIFQIETFWEAQQFHHANDCHNFRSNCSCRCLYCWTSRFNFAVNHVSSNDFSWSFIWRVCYRNVHTIDRKSSYTLWCINCIDFNDLHSRKSAIWNSCGVDSLSYEEFFYWRL